MLKAALIFLACMLSSPILLAQNNDITDIADDTRQFGPYTVHFSTLNSLFIPAQIAKVHKLVRAADQSLLNIAIKDTTSQKSVAAKIQATAKNLLQQSKVIDFKTIAEPDAVYYIGALRHSNEELFHIDITIQPEGSKESYQFRVTRKLYTE